MKKEGSSRARRHGGGCRFHTGAAAAELSFITEHKLSHAPHTVAGGLRPTCTGRTVRGWGALGGERPRAGRAAERGTGSV